MIIQGTIETNGSIAALITAGSGGSGNVQASKTAIPSDVEQTIIPDAGYDGIAQVIVERIPQSYGRIAYNGNSIRVY